MATNPVNIEIARAFYQPAAPKEATGSLREHVLGLELIADTVEALDAAQDMDPETREEIERELCAAIAGTREKIDRTAAVLAHFEAAAEAAQKEAERLCARRAYFTRQGERLEQYVLAVLTASNLKKLEGHTSTLASRKNPPSVVIDPCAEVPEEFKRQPPQPPAVPDKALIKRALQAGALIAGCTLKTAERLVRS